MSVDVGERAQHEVYMPVFKSAIEAGAAAVMCSYNKVRHQLNWYLAQRVPSFFLASSFRTCLNYAVLKGMPPWRTRYPLSSVPVMPVPTRWPACMPARTRTC